MNGYKYGRLQRGRLSCRNNPLGKTYAWFEITLIFHQFAQANRAFSPTEKQIYLSLDPEDAYADPCNEFRVGGKESSVRGSWQINDLGFHSRR